MSQGDANRSKERSVPPAVLTVEADDGHARPMPMPRGGHDEVDSLVKSPINEDDEDAASDMDYFDQEDKSSGIELRDLDDQEFEELITEAFNDVDEDNSGIIATEHLGSILDTLAEDGVLEKLFDEEELDKLKNDMDTDQNGLIPLNEFKDVLMRRRRGVDFSEDELREAFNVFDHKGRGIFTSAQLRQVMLHIMQNDLPLLDAKSMVMAASREAKDEIGFDEFKEILEWKCPEDDGMLEPD